MSLPVYTRYVLNATTAIRLSSRAYTVPEGLSLQFRDRAITKWMSKDTNTAAEEH